MRSILLLPLLLIGCVGDDSTTKDAGNDVTSTNDGSSDVASDVSSDAGDAGAFSPSTFGNALVLWLEGDVGVGADDAGDLTWLDQSPSPVTFTGSALTDTTPNGHVVLNFNATNVFVSTPSVAKLELGATDDFVIAGVMQTTSGTTEPPGAFIFEKAKTVGQLPSKSFGDGLMFGTNISQKNGQPEVWDFGANKDAGGDLLSSKNIDDGAYHVIIARRVGGTSMRVKLGGLEETLALANPIDVSQSTQPLAIGNVFNGEIFTGTFAIKLAEVVVVRRAGAFTPQEVGALEGYLKTKYNAQ